MNWKDLALCAGALLLIILLLAGCGGSGSAPGNNVANNLIEGVASKGIINGGQVKVHGINDDGTKGAELGSDLTNLDGQYSIDIGTFNGPVIVEVVGGSYTDEASGSVVGNNTLRAVIPPANGNRNAAITPLTEIAVQLADGSYTLNRINNANAAVAVLMGGADILETQPPDINEDMSGATDAEKDYTLLLAAISQMIEDGSAADVDDAIAIIKDDLEDDGELAVDGSGAGDLLQDALGNFVNSADNNTGLILDDITLDEALVEAADMDLVKFVMTKVEDDYDLDGIADDVVFNEYDNTCENRTVYEYDGDYQEGNPADGILDESYTYAYDDEGRVTRMEHYVGANLTLSEITTYVYNASGLSEIEIVRAFDSALRGRITYTYDASGNMTVEFTDSFINVYQSQKNYAYDASGNMILEQHDTDANGEVDSQKFYAYDVSGNQIYYGYDPDGDDAVTYYQRQTYDSDGNRLTSVYGPEVAGIETITALVTYIRDQYGNTLLSHTDTGGDGVIDSTHTFEYEYDAYGNMTRLNGDWFSDGIIDQSTIYTWQACNLPQVPFLFSGTDGVNEAELWTSDGTEAGTFMVMDIEFSDTQGGSFPVDYTIMGNKAYFRAYDTTHGYELWVSDGTEAGTHIVIDLWAGTSFSNPQYLTVFNDKLYFWAYDGGVGTNALWVTDGTEAGTVKHLDKDSNQLIAPNNFAVLGDMLMFSSSILGSDYELWVTDGTQAGTHLVKDIYPGSTSSGIRNIFSFGGKVYFMADDGVHASELWTSDGTDAGTYMVKDINSSGPMNGSGAKYFRDSGDGRFFFKANDGVHGYEPWVSDGTEAGTHMVKDVDPDDVFSAHFELWTFDGKALFGAADGVNGVELWISDGTEAGTQLLKDIYPGAIGSGPHDYRTVGGRVIFTAGDPVNGGELWVTDGTEAGTHIVKDITPGTGSSDLWDFRIYEDKLYFAANDGTHGNELWISDGTEAGTHITRDANPGFGDGYIGEEEDY